MVGCLVEVCNRRDLKVIANKKEVMILGLEEGSIKKIFVDEMRLEHVSEFKYLGCESG